MTGETHRGHSSEAVKGSSGHEGPTGLGPESWLEGAGCPTPSTSLSKSAFSAAILRELTSILWAEEQCAQEPREGWPWREPGPWTRGARTLQVLLCDSGLAGLITGSRHLLLP